MDINIDNNWKKRVAMFLVSQNVSLFGSSVVSFAINWYIMLQTSSGTWMMLATICSMLPQVVVSVFGGVLADRYSRKMLIMLADGFIALATLGLAISFLLGYQRLELLLMVSAVRSIGAGIQTPAVNAIYPQLVPEEHLAKVQGINQTLASVLMLVAPAVGGLLLDGVGVVGAFFVDVATASIAILIMSGIKIGKVVAAAAQSSIWSELKEGISYTFTHTHLRRIMICYLFSFFLITPAAILSPLMVERTFGSEVWRLSANEMAWTVGSLVGGIYVSVKGQSSNKARIIAGCLAAFGVLFALLGFAWDFTSFLVLMGISGFFMPLLATAQTVFIQEITDPAKLGRVFFIVQIITASAVPVAILLFGPLADVVSVESILVVSGVLLLVVGVVYGAVNKGSTRAANSL